MNFNYKPSDSHKRGKWLRKDISMNVQNNYPLHQVKY